MGLKNPFEGVGKGFWGFFGPDGGCGKAFWVTKIGILEVGKWAIYIFSAAAKNWGRSLAVIGSQRTIFWGVAQMQDERLVKFSGDRIWSIIGSCSFLLGGDLFFSEAAHCSSEAARWRCLAG